MQSVCLSIYLPTVPTFQRDKKFSCILLKLDNIKLGDKDNYLIQQFTFLTEPHLKNLELFL